MITENIEQYKGVFIYAQQVDGEISLSLTSFSEKQRILQQILILRLQPFFSAAM